MTRRVIGFFIAPSPPPTANHLPRAGTSMQMNHSTHKASLLAALLLGLGCFPFGGCRICADCEDLAYPAYGGTAERTRRYEGRVGSIFDPAGTRSPDLMDRDSPPDPDELERRRQGGKSNLFGPDESEPRSDSDQTPDPPPPSLDDLRNRQLDDIQNDNEDELRNRDLNNIDMNAQRGPNVQRGPNPNQPVTAALKRFLRF